MASSSDRNINDTSSDWVSFSPYNDEKTPNISTRRNTSNTIKVENSHVVSDSDAWPLDEMMDDIENQMDVQSYAMVDMARQLENIEVILSDAKSRRSQSNRVSSRSRLSLDICVENSCETYVNEHHRHYRINKDKFSTNKHSDIRALQKRSGFKRENGDGTFPIDPKPISEIVVETEDLVPPNQIQSPRYFRNKAVMTSSSSPPDISTPRESPIPQLKLPTPAADRASALVNPGYSNAKNFRSNVTWDESVSSQRSIPSNDVLESEESGFRRKLSLNRKIKWFLAILAIILLASIGIVLGLWAREQKNSKGRPEKSTIHQTPQLPEHPVIVVPADLNNPLEGISGEKNSSQETNQHDVPNDSYSNPSNSGRPVEDAAEQRPIQTPQDVDTLRVPTNEPTSVPIEIKPTETPSASNIDVNEPIADSSHSGYDYTAHTNFLVGVYYYPWHGERFHNGGGYMRKELIPRHLPALGEYNDSDPRVVAQHMKWFRQANIGLLVTSWWGPNRVEDSNTKDVIMEHDDVGNLKIALHYETTGRLGDGREKLPNAKTDIQYMCENYFDHPNYYTIDGRPVLFIYVSRKLDTLGTLEEALLTMRSTASKCGHNLYLIGDSVFESAPDPGESHVPFWYFDAVTNYDVYGSSGRPEGYAGTGSVDAYYRQQTEWKERALRDDCRYVPAVSPGYNDRGVRMERDHPPLSRRITSVSREGSLFQYQLKQAKELVDWKVDNMILVNSFNEWHEDTQIEPVVGNPSTQPFNFTKGLEYVGYGDLYLDILGAATSSDTTQHSKYDYLFRT